MNLYQVLATMDGCVFEEHFWSASADAARTYGLSRALAEFRIDVTRVGITNDTDAASCDELLEDAESEMDSFRCDIDTSAEETLALLSAVHNLINEGATPTPALRELRRCYQVSLTRSHLLYPPTPATTPPSHLA